MCAPSLLSCCSGAGLANQPPSLFGSGCRCGYDGGSGVGCTDGHITYMYVKGAMPHTHMPITTCHRELTSATVLMAVTALCALLLLLSTSDLEASVCQRPVVFRSRTVTISALLPSCLSALLGSVWAHTACVLPRAARGHMQGCLWVREQQGTKPLCYASCCEKCIAPRHASCIIIRIIAVEQV